MRVVGLIFIYLITTQCTSKFLKYEGEELTKVQKEFAQQVTVVEAEAPQPTIEPVTEPKKEEVLPAKKKKEKEISQKKKKEKKSKLKKESTIHEPDIEDSVGFVGRRPANDPFRAGEEVIHNVHYFKVSAGEFKFKVEPFVKVNDRLSYKWVTEITTSPMFNTFYSVEDQAVTLVDYETFIPKLYELHVKESGQLREGRAFFDEEKSIAKYYEKKITKDSGLEEKKIEWEMLSFSQNVFSALFYIRAFQWEVGKEIAFRVAHDNENLIFKAKALRKETLETELGPKPAIVIKPEVHVKGFFRPMGDIYIWLSDDDRKFVLRTESKIKVGTVISEVISIKP